MPIHALPADSKGTTLEMLDVPQHIPDMNSVALLQSCRVSFVAVSHTARCAHQQVNVFVGLSTSTSRFVVRDHQM